MVYNCRRYDYPAGSHVSIYSKSITRNEKGSGNNEKDAENFGKPGNGNFSRACKNEERTAEAEEHCMRVSLSATKNRIYNIARSNTWDWFITLTFDRNETDSSDYDMATYRLHVFLSNLQKRKCPGMKYLIVPELHADGEHYHFHGLLSGADALRFRFSGHYDKKGAPVFNILDWKHGFTTATRVNDSAKASGYITKYVAKDPGGKLKNKKRYLCSQNISRARPEFCLLHEDEFLAANAGRIAFASSVTVPAAHRSVNYYELGGGNNG